MGHGEFKSHGTDIPVPSEVVYRHRGEGLSSLAEEVDQKGSGHMGEEAKRRCSDLAFGGMRVEYFTTRIEKSLGENQE